MTTEATLFENVPISLLIHRYGDSLNPWGDLITMSRVWCILKPEARVLLGVPSGLDRIYFNAARTYGPIMLSHLFANFRLIYSEAKDFKDDRTAKSGFQPLFVLEKLE